jgi:hypothetical protein
VQQVEDAPDQPVQLVAVDQLVHAPALADQLSQEGPAQPVHAQGHKGPKTKKIHLFGIDADDVSVA